jgi:hypothetical protein
MKFSRNLSLILASSAIALSSLCASDLKSKTDDSFFNDRAGKVVAKTSAEGDKSLVNQLKKLEQEKILNEQALQKIKAFRPDWINEQNKIIAMPETEWQRASGREIIDKIDKLEIDLFLQNEDILQTQQKLDRAIKRKFLYEQSDLVQSLTRLANTEVNDPNHYSGSGGLEGAYLVDEEGLEYKKAPLVILVAKAGHIGQIPIILFDLLFDEKGNPLKHKNFPNVNIFSGPGTAHQFHSRHNYLIDYIYDAFFGVCPRAKESLDKLKNLDKFNQELTEFQLALHGRSKYIEEKLNRLTLEKNKLLKDSLGLIKQKEELLKLLPLQDKKSNQQAVAELKSYTVVSLKKLKTKIEELNKEKPILDALIEKLDLVYGLLKRHGRAS